MKMNDFNPNITILTPGADLSKGCAVAVGSFDGVHKGHRALLGQLVTEASRLSLPAVVFSFEAFDSPKSASGLLAGTELKNRLLCRLGVSAVVSLPFSRLKSISAESFALDFLFGRLGAKSIVCGYDFRFGKNRTGDSNLLKALLAEKGVEVHTCPSFDINGRPVSSTDIRLLIANGELEAANALLEREFSFAAEIEHGRALGRTLGFPTINQKYPDFLAKPLFGVYAARVILGGRIYSGVTNIGIKPTLGGEAEPVCETYLFDYSGDCYGESAELCLLHFIRGERKFGSLNELKAQVELDKQRALELLKGRLQ